MKFEELLEKTASLLESHAAALESSESEKVAASRMDLEEKLGPAIERYEKIAGSALSEDEREQILSGANPTMVAMLTKFASEQTYPEDMGGPEFHRTTMPSTKTASDVSHPRSSTGKGRRRSAREIKRATRMRENLA